MPIGFDFSCGSCDHIWTAFFTRYGIGPTEWTLQTYECLWCNIVISCPREIEATSWDIWYSQHESKTRQSPFLSKLAQSIQDSLAGKSRYASTTLRFQDLQCPICARIMELDPSSRSPRPCPACEKFTGECEPSTEIVTYEIRSWPPEI